jgi:aspartyl-tRNA(Asn)/glutamyl-tRNA(Gln) amidotransferase subunit B
VNANVCPVCLALPGALPVLNKKAVELAIKAGMAMNCTVNDLSVFSRKNYFYPDLPKGYQISQFDLPLCLAGHLDIEVEGQTRRIGITRIHMEEDAGKLLHQGSDAIAGSTGSLVDLNRACTPLIEIVSEPDIRSAEEARMYVETLRQILRTLGITDGNLEEGSMRVDINLSLRPVGTTAFGTRTEVKNVNSFRSIDRAIKAEFERQSEILNSGGKVIQQTRNYHDETQTTTALRDKEEAHDYRYFPDPDLLPLILKSSGIEVVLGELPVQIRERYVSLGLTDADFDVLLEDQERRAFFEACLLIQNDVPAKEVCKWILGDLTSLMKSRSEALLDSKITPQKLVELVLLFSQGTVSSKMMKEFLQKMAETGQDAQTLLAKGGGAQVSDVSDLMPVVEKVLEANPDVVEKIKAGKTQSAEFLMGQIMKETRGKAKPDVVRALIVECVTKL